MERFGVRPDDLPPGSRIINRPFSPWETYRWQIAGALATLRALDQLLVDVALRHGGGRPRRRCLCATDNRLWK